MYWVSASPLGSGWMGLLVAARIDQRASLRAVWNARCCACQLRRSFCLSGGRGQVRGMWWVVIGAAVAIAKARLVIKLILGVSGAELAVTNIAMGLIRGGVHAAASTGSRHPLAAPLRRQFRCRTGCVPCRGLRSVTCSGCGHGAAAAAPLSRCKRLRSAARVGVRATRAPCPCVPCGRTSTAGSPGRVAGPMIFLA